MKVIYENGNGKVSNFKYYSNLFKGGKVLYNFDLVEKVDNNETECENFTFDNKIKAKLYIDYPLSIVIEEDITFNTLHELISKIRDTYSQIFDINNKENKYGIWGHWIWDLVIEGITIYKKDNTILIRPSIGS